MATRYRFGFTGLQPNRFGMGSNSPMSQSYKNGRGYWDPERMEERFARAKLTAAENYAEGGRGGGGGGGRGGLGAGVPAAPQMPFSYENMADRALVNFGNAPAMGQDYAQSLARMQNGLGTAGDFTLLQQRNNPSMAPEANMANARLKSRQYAWMRQMRPPGGLVGAAQQALFG